MPHLPQAEREGVLREALAAVREIGIGKGRSRALVSLAPRLAELGDVQGPLWSMLEIGNEDACSKALARLALHLPQSEREGVLREALAVARQIGDGDARSEALAVPALHLAELPRAALFSLWVEMLRISSTRRRRDLLGDIRALAPVVVALGGGEAVAETVIAIKEVCRWWP